jgi:hypothetical protein
MVPWGGSAVPESGLNQPEQQKREPERSVEDARRRGWFWHWNTIITQYAPLVGLKGVGLLNSYTVWTDRREESPHHGYAFPTQQAEADFYGEDRAELITINKILVALGLIEIRKEMVTRVDERGRRWRVPHNLYRVRDHQDGYNLKADDVLRVVELAASDRTVYRYIRRIFSPRFSPIDADNVWHQMLPELRQNATWQALAERAEREDARASARTKAGHAKRAKTSNETSNLTDETSRQERDGEPASETPEPAHDTEPATSVGDINRGRETTVANGNTGLEDDVEPGNNALGENWATIADQRNEGDPNSVELGNSTYNQTSHTTTTTTTASFIESDRPDSAGAGPLLGPSLAVVTCFEAANDRSITPLEADLLAELERACASSAQRSGETGADWVVAAIREAVGSGSRFVAPKRINEILNRWSKSHSRDGLRAGAATTAEGVTNGSPPADFPLPSGRGAQATWEQALRLLSAVIERAEMERFFAGSGITGYQAGTVRVRVASREAAERLSGEYYELISRKLAEAMRRPVRIEFSAPGASAEVEATTTEPARLPKAEKEPAPRSQRPLPLPNFMLAGGLTNQQIWSSALEVLSGRVSAATWQTWLRPAALIGADEDGTLVLGAPNAFARQRLGGHLLEEVARTLAGLLERPVTLRVVVTQEWLRRRASKEADDEDGT